MFSDVTSTSLTVTWPAWDEESDLGYRPVEEYKIQIKENGETEFDEVAVGLNLSHSFENLKEDTEYHFRMVVVRNHLIGEGPACSIQTQRTLVKGITTERPFIDSGVQIRVNGGTNGYFSNESVRGRKPVSQSQRSVEQEVRNLRLGCSLSYGGRLTFGSDASSFDNQLLFGSGQRKKVFIFQQPPGKIGKEWSHTKYFLGSRGIGRIWTTNGQCRGPQSGQSLCPITEDRPCLDSKRPCDATPPSFSSKEPLSFTADSKSILVRWDAWNPTKDSGYGPIETYIVQIKEKGVGNFEGVRTGLNLFHKFENLTAGTQYEFRIIIVRDHPDGEGEPSEPQPQTTPSEGARFGQDANIHIGEATVTIKSVPGREKLTLQNGLTGYNPVLNLSAHPNNIGQLNLTWNPPDLDPTLYEVVDYNVTYVIQRHGACSENIDDIKSISVYDSGLVLTDLEDYAVYIISVKPRTRSINQYSQVEDYGSPVQIGQTTLPSVPVATMEPLQKPSPSSSATKLMFSWNPVSCEDRNGPNFTYNCVLYMLVDGNPPERIREVNVTQESHVFMELIPCGRYRLEVTPQNEMYSAATETVEASTISAPFGVVQDLSLTQNSENGGHITVEWQPPLDTFCPVTSYTVTTKLQKQQACVECVDEEENIIADIRNTSCVLGNLFSYATYIVSITAHGDDVAMSGAVLEDVFTTPKRAPSSSPSVMVESRTKTSLTFTWDPVPCTELNGVFMQYTYSLHQTDTNEIIESGSIRERSLPKATFTGLHPCTNYTFNVRVDNGAFNGENSILYAMTNLSIPGNDTNLSLRRIEQGACSENNKCLIATWKAPQSNNCPVEYQSISLHQITLDSCQFRNPKFASSFNCSKDQLEHEFSDLKPNSRYSVTLVVGNSVGSVTTTQELETSEGVPTGAPRNIQLHKQPNSPRVTIEWDDPRCGQCNGDIIKYNFKLYEEDGRSIIKSDFKGSNSHMFRKLRRDTTYAFSVKAYTKIGPGPDSLVDGEPYYFTTDP